MAFFLIGAMTVPCLLSVIPAAMPAANAAPQSRAGVESEPVAEITGSGSTWAQNAVDEWIANEYQNGINVVFNGDGSAAGRTNFALGTVDFAVSDIGYQGHDPVTGQDDSSPNRPYAYLPVTAGGTSFPYNLVVNGKRITNLRLSGKTLAEIFTNHITNWDDPAITADNNGRKLPSMPIITVVPSEGSGTSAQFTDYLNTLYAQYWVPFNGHTGMTEYWPQQGSNQVAQTGSAQVMNYISSAAANGSIGFDEYSYALQAGYPVVALENAAHYFVLPSEYNDAVALTKAQINYNTSSPDYLLETLSKVYTNPDPRAYPLSSYSYTIMPTSKTDELMKKSGSPGFPAKAQALADFLDYSICQGQEHIGPIGYSALPVNLVEAGFKQIEKIKAAAPQVNISALNIKNCHNPTFIAGHPTENYLAKIAPYPPTCAKAGNGPCSGILDANSNGGKGSGSKEGSGGGSSGSGGSGSGHSGSGSGGSGHSGSGNGNGGSSTNAGSGTSTTNSGGTTTTSGGSTGTTGNVSNVASTLPPGQATGLNDVALAVLAVLLLLAILIVPPLMYRRLSARGRQY
jgi:phosphate transport system substrate-binding protein